MPLQLTASLPKYKTIITGIRCSHKCMYMKPGRLSIRQKDARVMIKLQYNDRTLNAEIIRILVAIAPNPAEICVLKMAANLFFTDFTSGVR